MKIIVSCESCVDLPKSTLDKYNINVIPFPIIMGGTEFTDSIDINSQKIFDFVSVNKQLPKTAAINAFQYEEFFKSLVKDEDTYLFHFCLSSKISSTYSHAVDASDNVKNVCVVDSLSLSGGIALQVLNAIDNIKKIKDPDEMLSLILKYRDRVHTSFVIEKLTYLYKGGRCSALQMMGANILNLRPSIIMKDGVMTLGKKYAGKMDKVVEKYLSDNISSANIDLNRVIIAYSSATEEMLEAKDRVIKDRNISDYIETNAGATITSHCGPNTMGIFFVTKE